MEELIELYYGMLRRMNLKFHRYMYETIDWNAKMVGIAGPRGVGKTTMILQRIKESIPKEKALYVVADDIYFSSHTLLDTARQMEQMGYEYLFIDEIHKYEDWSRELKLIYDYHPALHVVFTASSVLDILRGEADLSRRALVYHMQGLSFREYMQLSKGITLPSYSLDEILDGKVDIDTQAIHPLAAFKKYLRDGYYPFASEGNFDMRLRQIIRVTMETDIPIYAKMNASTGKKLKQLMTIIAECAPFKPNFTKIAQELEANRALIKDYLEYMERAGMIAQLRDSAGGIQGLGKVDKTYLDNTNIAYTLSPDNANIGNVRETFFFNQMRVRNDVVSSKISDFSIGDTTFEVGGKGKGQRQLQGASHGFVVKDDIEYAQGNIIPLWHFGLNY